MILQDRIGLLKRLGSYILNGDARWKEATGKSISAKWLVRPGVC